MGPVRHAFICKALSPLLRQRRLVFVNGRKDKESQKGQGPMQTIPLAVQTIGLGRAVACITPTPAEAHTVQEQPRRNETCSSG